MKTLDDLLLNIENKLDDMAENYGGSLVDKDEVAVMVQDEIAEFAEEVREQLEGIGDNIRHAQLDMIRMEEK